MKVAVIGAGLAGVGAARGLIGRGIDVVIFEKSRGWGGRCATKRMGSHIVDHGAQYFTLRSGEFRRQVEAACGGDLLRITAPVLDEHGNPLPDDGRFYHREGNSRLVRALGSGLTVQTGTPVGPGGSLVIEGIPFDHVVTSAPLPQSLSLAGMPSGPAVSWYDPCLCAILVYRGRLAGNSASAYARSLRGDSALAWTACENHKAGRVDGDCTVIVAHCGVEFSRRFLESDPELWSADVRGEVERLWEIRPGALESVLTHRWRYARRSHGGAVPGMPTGWTLVGDSISESRVENAWLSGWSAGVSL